VARDSESVPLVVDLKSFIVDFWLGTERHYNSGRLGLLLEICDFGKREKVFENHVPNFGWKVS